MPDTYHQAPSTRAADTRNFIATTAPTRDILDCQVRTTLGLLGAVIALLALSTVLAWVLRAAPVRAAEANWVRAAEANWVRAAEAVPPAALAAPTPLNVPTSLDAPTGLFFRSGHAGDTTPESFAAAPLLGSEVEISVSGLVSRVTVRQHFRNPSTAWLEGVYVFPLPDKSAVDRLNMRVGARRIEGRLLERAEAKRVYDAAAAAGQRASMVSAERPNVFTTAIANIGPGEEITVEIEYQDSVAYDDGRYSLRFPMVVAPRYSPRPQGQAEMVGNGPTATGTSQRDDRDVFGPVRRHGDPTQDDGSDNLPRHNPLALEVTLAAGLPLGDIESLYHDVNIESIDEDRQRIRLSQGAVPADRDFVLEWTPRDMAAPQAAVFAEEVAGHTYLMVMLQPPAVAAGSASKRQPRDVTLVVDTSGSMHGPSMRQAKAAVAQALKRLDPSDRFNVISFDDETRALFPELQPATAENIAWAWHYIDAFEADGGTEMLPALVRALRGKSDAERRNPERLDQVVFITDGSVANEVELFGVIADRLADTRLFPVGIGSAPNSYFMRKAAEAGRGSFVHIGDVEEVGARMTALLRKLEAPALTSITTGWPTSAGKTVEIYPNRVPDLYDGEPVVFTARLDGVGLAELEGHLLISGRGGNGNWQRRLQLDRLNPAPGVAAIWARAKLDDIEDGIYRGGEADSVRAQALAVALEHGLVTRYTSLVAVDEVVARPTDKDLEKREIARNLPRGWDHESVFGIDAETRPQRAELQGLMKQSKVSYLTQAPPLPLPRGATPAALRIFIGTASVLMGGLLLLLLLRRRWLDDVQ